MRILYLDLDTLRPDHLGCYGYDCGIRYMDQHIGHLLDALDRQGVLEDLMIIVSADHGENFGELGLYAEHATADLPTCRIPFIVRWPSRVPANEQRHGLHYNLDLAPTLAELLDTPAQPEWDGVSFASSLVGGQDQGHDELIRNEQVSGSSPLAGSIHNTKPASSL